MRTKYTHLRKHEQTDSNKLNAQYLNASQDIADLYRAYIEMKNDIESQNVILPETTTAITSEIQSLKTQLDEIAQNRTLYSMYDNTNIMYPSSISPVAQATYEQNVGEVTLPVASTSVEYHFINPKDGKRVLIDNPHDFVNSYFTNNRFKSKVSEIYENTNINAIDIGSNKAHVAKVRVRNSAVNDLTLVYNLDTEEIRDINKITVYPVPELNCSYEDVVIQKSNGVFSSVNDISGKELEFPIANARKRIFRFPVEQVSGVSVLLNTTNYSIIDDLGTKEFIIGARLIKLEDIIYINEGYIGVKIDKPDGKTTIGKITPVYEGEAENINVQVYDSASEFNAASESTIMSGNVSTIQNIINTNLDTDSMWILFKLNLQENDTTPILKGVSVTWLA